MNSSQQTLPMDVEERKIARTVNVKLTNTDIARLGDEAAKALTERKLKEAELEKAVEEITKPLKAEISQCEAKIENLLEVINKREEMKTVDVVERKVFNANTVEYWHEGEKVEERAMTSQERQIGFFSDGEVKHGDLVDQDSDEGLDAKPVTDEEVRADIQEVIRSEQRADKPSTLIQ